MKNYSLIERREVKGIIVVKGEIKNIFMVDIDNADVDDGIKSIDIIDLKERMYLVNFNNGESEMSYDVSSVLFSK